MTFVQSSSPEITYFLSLKEHYRAKMIKVRNSRLKSELDEIDHKLDDLRELVKKCSEIIISPSVGLSALTMSCIHKQRLLTDIGTSLCSLSKLVSDRQLLNDLRRRIT